MSIYGLYDATIGYPRRGEAAASRLQFLYLDALTKQGREYAVSRFESGPRAEFQRLRSMPRSALTDVERAELRWLEQLSIIGKLDEAHTTIPDAQAAYQDLARVWLTSGGTTRAAEELSWFDIPVQWLIFGSCGAIALYLGVLFARVAASRYGWDPAEQRLYLPDGSSLVPADIEEFDKRRWDKFLVFLKVKPGHERHAGREIRLDLYRHDPLEEWVLQMEKTAFPERAEEPPPAPAPAT
jgi:hypothetical protein